MLKRGELRTNRCFTTEYRAPLETFRQGGRTWEGSEWCPGADSNHRHHNFQSCALPTELPGHTGGLLVSGGRAAAPEELRTPSRCTEQRRRLIGPGPGSVQPPGAGIAIFPKEFFPGNSGKIPRIPASSGWAAPPPFQPSPWRGWRYRAGALQRRPVPSAGRGQEGEGSLSTAA